ncbi:hypothetical protein VIGAN_04023400 [Vigna angularis var. angularis]|uniref:Mei2-like C-terminal RNA recognition motif domain-containing protein n=1 Tax=Vigna angularis var. angularis TaxID=157739 RepID=A0A0S3RR90_PHAAN|nr:protein MEI2-like 4 isoform X2 [Vigna angularis]BAT83130.1 hypothetical protein VIGAN_04023400 [Vigna angularis var. angularis]
MPSETIDFNCFSSSLYSSEDICSSKEVSLWKSDNMPKCYDFDQGIKTSLSVQALSHLPDRSKVNIVATQNESSLFSSSLSDLFSRKLRSSANNALYGHSVDTVASHYEEERLFDSLEELEAQIIGNLLPSDDDFLSAVTNELELDQIIQDSSGDDMDELDLFSSLGGMDLGDDNSPSSGQKNSEILDGACNSQLGLCSALIDGEKCYDKHPSRTLVVRNISSDVKDSELSSLSEDTPSKKDMNQGTLVVFLYDSSISNNELHRIFNVYGEIKEIRKSPHDLLHHKLIEYYDSRAADAALHALNRDDTIRKRLKVEPYLSEDSKQSMAQQIHPELERKESSLYLHQNSPPLKSPTSFPGLHGISEPGKMDGGRILGVEPASCTPSVKTASVHGVSSGVPKSLPSLVSVKSFDNRCEITEYDSPGQLNFDVQDASASHPPFLPEFHDGLANSVCRISTEMAANINLKTQERIESMQFCPVNSYGRFMEFNECVFKSSGNVSFPLPPGHHYKCGNFYQPPEMMWPNSPLYFDGVCPSPTLPRLHGLPRSPSNMMTTVLPINSQHVASAPFWDRRHTYAGESLGNMQFSGNTTSNCVDFVSCNFFPHFGGNCVDFRILPKHLGLHFHNQKDLMFPGRNHMINSFETHKQRTRSRRTEGVSDLADKKQYELDIDRIKRGEDIRTTLMIKNIPNKYTSKMLLAAIDERHRGTYDFVYLPIDFRNKCNVGYAFINITNPDLIIPFYQVFNGKKWEKFNSEKVASLAYARIQGKAALIAHFQNSSLMNEDKRCRPILFNTDGPNAGDQVPFPVGINIRNKSGRVRSSTQEDSLHGSQHNLGISKLSSDGDGHSLESD